MVPMFVQAHCYDDGASFTYMPSTGPSLDPSAPPAMLTPYVLSLELPE